MLSGFPYNLRQHVKKNTARYVELPLDELKQKYDPEWLKTKVVACQGLYSFMEHSCIVYQRFLHLNPIHAEAKLESPTLKIRRIPESDSTKSSIGSMRAGRTNARLEVVCMAMQTLVTTRHIGKPSVMPSQRRCLPQVPLQAWMCCLEAKHPNSRRTRNRKHQRPQRY